MTRRAALALLIYLPIHTVLMPVAINWHAAAYPGVYTTLEYNVSYLVVSFAAVLIMGFGYLRREFDTLLDNKMPALITLIQGYFIYILLGYLMVTAILLLAGNITWSNPNDANIVGMAAGDTRKVLAMTVFLGPMIEETLFRGALEAAQPHCGLRRVHRALRPAARLAVRRAGRPGPADIHARLPARGLRARLVL